MLNFASFKSKCEGGFASLLQLYIKAMINKELIEKLLQDKLQNTDCFLVDVTISSDNNIVVEIDSDTAVNIDLCVEISRYIESHLDRDVEDFELEVGSAGLTSPLKGLRQYKKNIGNEVEVLTKDGRKIKGILSAADETSFSVDETKMLKKEGDKRKRPYTETLCFDYNQVKYTKYIINIK